MKRRIDLFSQRIFTKTFVNYLDNVRIVSLYVFIALIGVVILLSSAYFFLSSKLNNLTKKRSTYNRYIVLNTPFVQDLRRFAIKYSLLKSILQDDAKSYSYYNHLQSILIKAPVQGTITNFTINNAQEAEFIITFASYSDAISFIEYSENPDFLEQFTTISLNEFQIQKDEDVPYNLSYSGTFVQLP